MPKVGRPKEGPKGNPVPTRFDPEDDAALEELHQHTGLPKAHIVQRAVKLLISEVKRRGEAGWIITELGPERPPLSFVSPKPANVVAGKFIQPQRRTGTISLPELGSIAAGDEDQMEELMKQADFHIDVPAWYADMKAAFVLRVKGDSMNAAQPEPIFNGTRVIMALRNPVEGEIIAALIDGKTTLKRFVMEQGKPVLVSESTNPVHRNILPLEGLEWKGVMVGRAEV